MEDHPLPKSDERIKPEKRRYLRGSFLSSWLRKRNFDDYELKAGEDEEDQEEKDRLPSKIIKRFSKIFRSLVGVNKINETDTDRLKKEQFEDARNKTTLENSTDLGESLALANQPEYEGLLPVSDEAKKQYLGEESVEEYVEDTDLTEMGQSINTAQPVSAASEQNVNLANSPEKVRKHDNAVSSTADILRKRREKQLKRDVERIKKQAKSQKLEQQEIKKQQEEFSAELQRKSAGVENTVQNPAVSTSGNQETELRLAAPEKPTNPVTIDRRQESSIQHSGNLAQDQNTEQLKKIVQTEDQYRPETIQKTVEKAAEYGVPIESLYERRHEAKGEQDYKASTPATLYAARGVMASVAGILGNSYRTNYNSPKPKGLVQPAYSGVKSTDSELINQAAKGGAISGILLLLMFALIIAFLG